MKKEYQKTALTFEQQYELLLSRGMIIDDKESCLEILSNVSYYRLSAYWYPFLTEDDRFQNNTQFNDIWERYLFDRQLRCLIFDAIERVEISIKTKIINAFSLKYGPFGHCNQNNFKAIRDDAFDEFLRKIENEVKLSREHFVTHYKEKYRNEDLPIWMVSELMSFGTLGKMYKNLDKDMKMEIASLYGVREKVFSNWLGVLNYIRNICAHHSRLWNKELAVPPIFPNKVQYWHNINTTRIFSVIAILRYMLLFCAPNTHWLLRLKNIIKKYNSLPIDRMGFPVNWENFLDSISKHM